MRESGSFPISIDNVVYLDGKPPQEALAAVASQFVDDEQELRAKFERFSAVLARHGRPHGDKHIEIHYGPRLIDLVGAGDGVLRRAQWFLKPGDPPVIEGHGHEIDGWWGEGGERVLFHVPFGRGLTIAETACVLAESPTPAQALVDALAEVFAQHEDDDSLDPTVSLFALLPESIKMHFGPSFVVGHRVARLSLYYGPGDEDGRVFNLREGWTLKDLQRRSFWHD